MKKVFLCVLMACVPFEASAQDGQSSKKEKSCGESSLRARAVIGPVAKRKREGEWSQENPNGYICVETNLNAEDQRLIECEWDCAPCSGVGNSVRTQGTEYPTSYTVTNANAAATIREYNTINGSLVIDAAGVEVELPKLERVVGAFNVVRAARVRVPRLSGVDQFIVSEIGVGVLETSVRLRCCANASDGGGIKAGACKVSTPPSPTRTPIPPGTPYNATWGQRTATQVEAGGSNVGVTCNNANAHNPTPRVVLGEGGSEVGSVMVALYATAVSPNAVRVVEMRRGGGGGGGGGGSGGWEVVDGSGVEVFAATSFTSNLAIGSGGRSVAVGSWMVGGISDGWVNGTRTGAAMRVGEASVYVVGANGSILEGVSSGGGKVTRLAKGVGGTGQDFLGFPVIVRDDGGVVAVSAYGEENYKGGVYVFRDKKLGGGGNGSANNSGGGGRVRDWRDGGVEEWEVVWQSGGGGGYNLQSWSPYGSPSGYGETKDQYFGKSLAFVGEAGSELLLVGTEYDSTCGDLQSGGSSSSPCWKSGAVYVFRRRANSSGSAGRVRSGWDAEGCSYQGVFGLWNQCGEWRARTGGCWSVR